MRCLKTPLLNSLMHFLIHRNNLFHRSCQIPITSDVVYRCYSSGALPLKGCPYKIIRPQIIPVFMPIALFPLPLVIVNLFTSAYPKQNRQRAGQIQKARPARQRVRQLWWMVFRVETEREVGRRGWIRIGFDEE